MADQETVREKTSDLQAVVMLDVLGARVRDMATAARLADSLLEVLASARRDAPFMASVEELEATPPSLHIFGDTITLVFPPESLKQAIQISLFCSSLVSAGLQGGLAFRGAVGMGQLVSRNDGGVLLGPAITDVAEWYDELDAIGVIATPRYGMVLEEMAAKGVEGRFPQHAGFVKYEVPLRDGSTTGMWMLGWPYWARPLRSTAQECQASVYRMLQQFEIPRIAQRKFTNTVQFLLWYLSNYPPTDLTDLLCRPPRSGAPCRPSIPEDSSESPTQE